MKRKMTKYTDEFKLQIVKLIENGKTIKKVLEEYSLPQSTVEGWLRKYKNSGSFRDIDNLTEEEKELRKLQKRNKQLEMENDILKQAALILGRK